MKISKWLIIPMLALACCVTVGCGPTGNTTIESEEVSETEQKKADEDYDAQYESEYDNYE